MSPVGGEAARSWRGWPACRSCPQVVHRAAMGAAARAGPAPVGHYLDVGADAPDEAQQGQPVQGADGVVGDKNDPAAGGNVLELGLAHPAVEVELSVGLLDEVQTAQVGMARGKAGEGLLVQQASSAPASSGTEAGLAGEAGRCCPNRVSTSNMGKAPLNFAPA